MKKKKEQGQNPVVLTEQACLKKDLLCRLKEMCSCGKKVGNPSSQDGLSYSAQVANQNVI